MINIGCFYSCVTDSCGIFMTRAVYFRITLKAIQYYINPQLLRYFLLRSRWLPTPSGKHLMIVNMVLVVSYIPHVISGIIPNK